jgi:peptidoglycan hydrolase-like protein with peptidoglycan-binding domain
MPHPFCELRVRTVVWLALLVAIPALPATATAQDTAAAPSLSPRLLVDASWHGRPIRRPLPTRSDVADRAPALRAGTGFGRPGGSQRVRDLQRRLSRLGYRPGTSDGLFGPRTQAAVLAFQRKHGLDRTGAVGSATLRVLRRRTTTGAAPEAVQPAAASPVRSAPAPATARPAPGGQVTPASPADTSDGAPLLLVLLALALALPLLVVAGLRARRRLQTAKAPAPAPATVFPASPAPRMPARRTRPIAVADLTTREEPPAAEQQVVPNEISAVTRRAPLPHAAPQERRMALRERILVMRSHGMTLQEIADQLTEDGEMTLGGGRQWHPWNVRSATRPINPNGRASSSNRHG